MPAAPSIDGVHAHEQRAHQTRKSGPGLLSTSQGRRNGERRTERERNGTGSRFVNGLGATVLSCCNSCCNPKICRFVNSMPAPRLHLRLPWSRTRCKSRSSAMGAHTCVNEVLCKIFSAFTYFFIVPVHPTGPERTCRAQSMRPFSALTCRR